MKKQCVSYDVCDQCVHEALPGYEQPCKECIEYGDTNSGIHNHWKAKDDPGHPCWKCTCGDIDDCTRAFKCRQYLNWFKGTKDEPGMWRRVKQPIVEYIESERMVDKHV